MKIVVCVKQVPDTFTQVRIGPSGRDIVRDDLSYVLNPYDEYALEEALRLRERIPGTQVHLASVGSRSAAETLRAGLALGADEAHLVPDERAGESDSLAIAMVLAKAVQHLAADMVWLGWKAVDDDNAQVGPMLAELLGWPLAAFVVRCDLQSGARALRVHRETEGGIEVAELSLPCVLTAQKGLNEPRYASLPGIMASKKKPIREMSLSDLGLDSTALGEGNSRVKLLDLRLPQEKTRGRLIDGAPPDAVRELVRLLREEAKVI